MFRTCSSKIKFRAATRLTVVFFAAALSWPAQTGQNAPGSDVSEMRTFLALKGAQFANRRVQADFCRTDAEIRNVLMHEGFLQIVLGANSGTGSIDATARFGPGRYALRIDRCTGRLQGVRTIELPAT